MWVNEINKIRKQNHFSFTCHLRSLTSQAKQVRKAEENSAGCKAKCNNYVILGRNSTQCSPNGPSNIPLQNHGTRLHGKSHALESHYFTHIKITLLPRSLQPTLFRETSEVLSKSEYFSTRQAKISNFKESYMKPKTLTSATKTSKAPARNWLSHSD